MGDFNKTHPELREGEMFLCNVLGPNALAGIKWKTKRIGTQAFDETGKRISGAIPVFVTKSELESEGIETD